MIETLPNPMTKLHTRIYLDLFERDAGLVELTNFFAEVTLLMFELLDFPSSVALIGVVTGSNGMENLTA
jgi:hypothetical protein